MNTLSPHPKFPVFERKNRTLFITSKTSFATYHGYSKNSLDFRFLWLPGMILVSVLFRCNLQDIQSTIAQYNPNLFTKNATFNVLDNGKHFLGFSFRSLFRHHVNFNKQMITNTIPIIYNNMTYYKCELQGPGFFSPRLNDHRFVLLYQRTFAYFFYVLCNV